MAAFTAMPIVMNSIKCSYEQLQHMMKSDYNSFLFCSQANSKRMAWAETRDMAMEMKCCWGKSSSRAHVITAANRGTRQLISQTKNRVEATINKPTAQTSKGHDHSRASATSAARRATRGQTAHSETTATTVTM